jgi:N-acetylmuramic acid 6-phosphate etherase
LTRKTEQLPIEGVPIDMLPLVDAAAALGLAQVEAARSVLAPVEVIAAGAAAMADTIRRGGTLYYAAAGSSGLMAAADAMELKGTFGISPTRVRILMAGGIPRDADMDGDVEDEVAELKSGMSKIAAGDCLIAVSASGATPFTLAAAELACAAGAVVIAIANNVDAPLFGVAHYAVHLDTPPELLAGSTRLGSGTAQKIALNMLSTLMGVALGHVHQGMMVNVRADNAKLRDRAHTIVRRIADVDGDSAARALSLAGGNVKMACLLALGASSMDDARAALSESGGQLRSASAFLGLRTI